MPSIWPSTGKRASSMGKDPSYDLIILDIYLPKLDGLAALKKLRAHGVRTPVLLLTVRATIEDKVLGLDSGADDYLTKPFAFQELLARVRALLRRRMDTGAAVIRIGDLVLDPASRIVSRGARRSSLP